MKTLTLAPILLALSMGSAAPALAQAIPDNIPDKPGESPADRERERMEERFRGFFSRFYTSVNMDLAPITAGGFAYGGTITLGMNVENGDNLFLTVSARDFPSRYEVTSDPIEPGRAPEQYVGVGYGLSGTRFFGETETGWRTALNMGVGVLSGEVSVLAFEVGPTYDLISGDAWAVPAGIKLNVATFGNDVASVTRAFLGVSLGVRWHWGQRERLDLK